MYGHSHNEYLESKVLTAPSHKLHLMLIDGSLRFGRQAIAALESGDIAASEEPLLRAVDIVGELLVGVRDSQSEVNIKLAQLYLFVFRQLVEAKVNADIGKLADALSVLEYERETWQLLCEQQADDPGVSELASDAQA